MIKQKSGNKITKLGKQRLNLFQLEKRVAQLESATKLQARQIAYLQSVNTKQDLLNDDLYERVEQLEQPQAAQSAVGFRGIWQRLFRLNSKA